MNGTARLQLPKKQKKNKKQTNNENEVQAINYPRSDISPSVCKLDFAAVGVEKGSAKKPATGDAAEHMAGRGAARKNVVLERNGKETCASGNLQPLDAPLVNHGFRPVREAWARRAEGDS